MRIGIWSTSHIYFQTVCVTQDNMNGGKKWACVVIIFCQQIIFLKHAKQNCCIIVSLYEHFWCRVGNTRASANHLAIFQWHFCWFCPRTTDETTFQNIIMNYGRTWLQRNLMIQMLCDWWTPIRLHRQRTAKPSVFSFRKQQRVACG